MDTKKRIGDTEELGGFADHLDFAKPFEFCDVQPPAGVTLAQAGPARQIYRARRRCRRQFLDEASLCLRRKAKQVARGFHRLLRRDRLRADYR